MSWQQYPSWTPLPGGDLGHQQPNPNAAWGSNFATQDTGYHGASPSSYPNSSYEMHNLHESRSQKSLISQNPAQEALIQKDDTGKSVNQSGLSGYLVRRGLTGWKVGVLTCTMTTITVFLLNLILTIWAVSTHSVEGGLSYLYTGSCTDVAQMSLWIHLAINVMSTLLLSASNYTMQIISSPTRKEIDKAHQQFKWLDVGIPSTRNLTGISWGRIIMWAILGLSSVPLHLMYNSAVFSSLSANSYRFWVVDEGFFTAGNLTVDYPAYNRRLLESMQTKAKNGTLVKYENADCMALYSTTFVSKYRNLLLVSSAPGPVYASDTWDSYDDVPFYWICGDGYIGRPYQDHDPVCTLSKAVSKASSWTVKQQPIDYCMVETIEEKCRLSFSLVIMVVVIIANLTKAGVMGLTLWKLKAPTLVTIGDAIASFLERPDPTTEGICLSTKSDIRSGLWRKRAVKTWKPKSRLWFRAASVKRWIICNVLCSIAIITGIVLLQMGKETLGISDIKTLYSLGFGKVSANALVGVAPKGLVPIVLFANMPQAILSFLYLAYNGLYSCMLEGHEWSLFAKSRRPLRVTSPEAKQRTTYWLQLPYYYAVPLLVLSGLLHWLMSQSLFLAYVDIFDEDGDYDYGDSIASVGYSCIAIFFSIIVGCVAVVLGIANGFRRYHPGIPVVGGCSAAISAACQRPLDDTSAALLPVQWGAVDSDPNSDVGHCCLSSFEVMMPIEGGKYAGKAVKED